MKHISTVIAVIGIALVLGVSLVVGAQRQDTAEDQFEGTDAVITQMLEDEGAESWFEPVLALDSGELESGLFAFQAALGGILLGYCVGRLHGRRQNASPAPAGASTS
ncbi:MAG: energy-coupling factor ABC transporter substrate-binding protein [Mobilicoccus sp.]|nr:energy-coupling factor ABC transporter substrate-binding protein [Mobilicoccus sp.]